MVKQNFQTLSARDWYPLTLYSVKACEPLAFARQPGNKAQKELSFRKDILELKAQIEAGTIEFTTAAQRKIDKYLICSQKGPWHQLKVGFNDKAIAEAKKYFGCFALVSNQTMETFSALKNYRLREKIDELFAVQTAIGSHRWSTESVSRDRLFLKCLGVETE